MYLFRRFMHDVYKKPIYFNLSAINTYECAHINKNVGINLLKFVAYLADKQDYSIKKVNYVTYSDNIFLHIFVILSIFS